MYILMVTFYITTYHVLAPITLEQEISCKSQLEYIPWAVSKNMESLEKEVVKVRESKRTIFINFLFV